MMESASLGILVGPKGRGTNLKAIAEACSLGQIRAHVKVVVAPRQEIPAVEYSRNRNLPVSVVPPDENYEHNLLQALFGCDWICLAGFTRLLPQKVLDAHPGRVLNIHPSLLPKFGGKGMYGLRVHEAVLAAGETLSGCTVHLVSSEYDEGAPVMQLSCPVLPDDTPETLAARVLELEKVAYPAAIQRVLNTSHPDNGQAP